MLPPIRTLPIVERWDCRGCGDCCWGVSIPLTDEELERIRSQSWHKRPEFRGVKLFKRLKLFGRRYRLAHRRDGYCVFLSEEGHCRIHGEFGSEAKPLICQTFPLQLVPIDRFAYLTLRRSCPTAAADEGRELSEHVPYVRQLLEKRPSLVRLSQPPSVVRGHRRGWKDTLRVAECLERIMCDERFPPVRRIMHGLEFCRQLSGCRLRALGSDRFAELIGLLHTAAIEEAGRWFADRRPPRPMGAKLFRQTALEYVRLHPSLQIERSWRERLRLIRWAWAFAKGRGPVPQILPDTAATTFEALEEPLGHLDAEVLQPLGRFLETAAASKSYAFRDRRGWSLVESFQMLGLSFALSMWLFRLYGTGSLPDRKTMIDVVGVIDRGQRYPLLAGWRHRTRVGGLARSEDLQRLVAWYAR